TPWQRQTYTVQGPIWENGPHFTVAENDCQLRPQTVLSYCWACGPAPAHPKASGPAAGACAATRGGAADRTCGTAPPHCLPPAARTGPDGAAHWHTRRA